MTNSRRGALRALATFGCVPLFGGGTACTVPPIGVIDEVPAGVPRGHVLFYYINNKQSPGYSCDIYSIKDGDRTFEARTSAYNLDLGRGARVGIRIAKPPGVHNFAVTLGDADLSVRVRVEPNLVTPVQIVFANTEGKLRDEVSFSMALEVEKPEPVPPEAS